MQESLSNEKNLNGIEWKKNVRSYRKMARKETNTRRTSPAT